MSKLKTKIESLKAWGILFALQPVFVLVLFVLAVIGVFAHHC